MKYLLPIAIFFFLGCQAEIKSGKAILSGRTNIVYLETSGDDKNEGSANAPVASYAAAMKLKPDLLRIKDFRDVWVTCEPDLWDCATIIDEQSIKVPDTLLVKDDRLLAFVKGDLHKLIILSDTSIIHHQEQRPFYTDCDPRNTEFFPVRQILDLPGVTCTDGLASWILFRTTQKMKIGVFEKMYIKQLSKED